MAHGVKTGGRHKGSKNKIPAGLAMAILKAAEAAGNETGMVGYLTAQAILNPGPFMGLLGKVLPTTLAGDTDKPLRLKISWES
jgi:hypothetical protein